MCELPMCKCAEFFNMDMPNEFAHLHIGKFAHLVFCIYFLPQRKSMDVKIEPSWKEVLKHEFSQPYFFKSLHPENRKLSGKSFIRRADSSSMHLYNPFDKVKVILLGQDPYHGPGQAHGLSFSVLMAFRLAFMINIFKELQTDIGMAIPRNGNLTRWAQQGVLLLNASLTVRANEPMSHSKIGWAEFTDTVITKNIRKRKISCSCYGENSRRKNRCD